MKTLGYYNGRYDEIDRMMIPMNDRVCFFGDGVYDAQPCRNHKIFALDEHIDRFFRSAAALEISIPVSKEELKQLLIDLVAKMDSSDLFIYYQATRGTAPREHVFPEVAANLWVTIKPMTFGDGRKPIQMITLEDTRYFHCNIKTLNLIPSVMAAEKAKRAGCEEAVLYRPGGRVTECAHSNVSIIKDGVLVTAPADELILPGIARAHLLSACRCLGIETQEKPYLLSDLFDADEVIVTSSTKLCRRGDIVDGKPVGGRRGDLYEKIRESIIQEFLAETE
ncbi:MAG: aminotransferase class IV [Clostridiales bacterium]|nr:aminotransferase class IV [Clostridiales bacterium]